MSEYQNLQIPTDGEKVAHADDGKLQVPDNPIICFIEGDGIGIDITPVMKAVVDASVAKAYDGKKQIKWLEVYAGEKAAKKYDGDYLPTETLNALREFAVSIKGPLSTPVGGGMRSLNVAIRQKLDLYACVRPVCYFSGVISPLRHPELTDMVIFRENSEDIYLGAEFEAGSEKALKLAKYLNDELDIDFIPFPETSGYGIKPVSKDGTTRLVRRAINYAIDNGRKSVTLVHKGNIMKYTEGAFRNWGYELAKEEFGATEIDGGPWCEIKREGKAPLIVNDFIADNFLQKILLNTGDYDVIATLNLNGDYISDALAAQVGGIGIAPGANLSDSCAVFEATHGTAPKHTGLDDTNPGSIILSAEMMLRHLGWLEAADCLNQGMRKAIKDGNVTYDLAKGRSDATKLPSSKFGEAIVVNIQQS